MSARLRNLNPYELHKYLVNVYCLNAKGSTELIKRDTSNDKTDLDVIRENHRFLWEEDDVADTWEKQLARKYYDKLFKEYCICDLTRFKENKVALRWRIEQEVVMGKGQFQCGNKKCNSDQALKSWEVNFAYLEDREKKNALVKLRLCPECSDKLNYKSKKREVKRLKKINKKAKKNKRKRSSDKEETEGEFSPRTPENEEPSTSAEAVETTVTETDESLWKKGLCPECSDKLNYKSKKREVKRLKKINKKAKKNKRKRSSDKEETEGEFSPRTPENEEPSTSAEAVETTVTETDESLWKKGVQETEEKSREEEFQEYLDDLLL